MRFFNNKKA